MNTKKIGWVLAVIALSVLFPLSASAEYGPSEEFVAKMEALIKSSSLQTIGGPFFWKEVRAGIPFQEGDVAYYAISADTSGHFENGNFLQMEEWRRQTDGKLLATYTVMGATWARRWTWVAGTLATTKTEELDMTSQEVMAELTAKSERAQRLLLERGRPVVLGGTEM